MIQEYVHQELNQEVTAIGGYYLLVKEVRLPYHGREVLYLVGHAAFDTACCGTGGCAYALVPGFMAKWKHRTNEEGLAVSQVEPIQDPHIQEQVRTLIDKREMVHQFRFQQGIGFVRLLARSRKQRRKNHGKALAKAL